MVTHAPPVYTDEKTSQKMEKKTIGFVGKLGLPRPALINILINACILPVPSKECDGVTCPVFIHSQRDAKDFAIVLDYGFKQKTINQNSAGQVNLTLQCAMLGDESPCREIHVTGDFPELPEHVTLADLPGDGECTSFYWASLNKCNVVILTIQRDVNVRDAGLLPAMMLNCREDATFMVCALDVPGSSNLTWGDTKKHILSMKAKILLYSGYMCLMDTEGARRLREADPKKMPMFVIDIHLYINWKTEFRHEMDALKAFISL